MTGMSTLLDPCAGALPGTDGHPMVPQNNDSHASKFPWDCGCRAARDITRKFTSQFRAERRFNHEQLHSTQQYCERRRDCRSPKQPSPGSGSEAEGAAKKGNTSVAKNSNRAQAGAGSIWESSRRGR